MTGEERQLSDLVSIGPAMLRDFELLGVRTVAQLARRNPEQWSRERKASDACR
jgi:predicted RecB family nuclease